MFYLIKKCKIKIKGSFKKYFQSTDFYSQIFLYFLFVVRLWFEPNIDKHIESNSIEERKISFNN